MKDINAIFRHPGILILGRRVLRRNLAVWYAVLSFLLIFILGTDMGSASLFPFAVLYSWVGLLASRILSPLEGLLNRYGMDEMVAGPVVMAVLLIVFILLYLMLLFIITKTTSRISRAAGLIAPLLLHFLGSFFLLTPRPRLDLWMLGGWREAFYYAACVVSLTLVVGYLLISWLIVNKAADQKTTSQPKVPSI